MQRFLCVGVMMLVVSSGCVARFPMGLSRTQWEALTPAKQADFQRQQYLIDEKRIQHAAAVRIERDRVMAKQAAIAAEQARLERQRIEERYASARYRDVVTVSVHSGVIQRHGKRYALEPIAFDLVRGETKAITFQARGDLNVRTTMKIRLTEDGNTLYVNDSERERLVLLNQSWERGQAYSPQTTMGHFSVLLSDAIIHVAFKPLPGEPERVILEHR